MSCVALDSSISAIFEAMSEEELEVIGKVCTEEESAVAYQKLLETYQVAQTVI